MAKETYKYMGKRRLEDQGIEKSFDKKDLTSEKLKRLEEKGWVKVANKPKATKKDDE